MQAGDLMRKEVLTFRKDDSLEEVLDVLVKEHINGAPVVDDQGQLVGVISQPDIYFGKMTRSDGKDSKSGKDGARPLLARDIMTSPAVTATEDTEIVDLCRMMCKLRIHRLPIVREGKVTGIISTLDICKTVADGRLVPSQPPER
jgi:CBS domain-containing protein